MSLKVVWTTKFKRDYKRAMKRGLDMNRLDGVIRTLAAGRELAVVHRDHALGACSIVCVSVFLFERIDA